MRTTARLLFFFLLLFLVPNGAIALDRVAFIIGNEAYPDVPLDNAVRDARAVKAMLTEKLGFPEAGILLAEDADRLTIFEKFEEFKGLAKEADIVMVFYAGHGMESLDGKENFLIPIDAQIAKAAQSEAALRATGVNLMDLSTQLAAATTGAKIILMDCCRERPAGRGAIRAGGGLVTYADAEIPADTLMILAAAPNRVASDGEQHGPFTEALLEVLPGNGNNLMDAFFAVSDRVREVTGDQQVPWLKFDGSGQIFRQQKFLAVANGMEGTHAGEVRSFGGIDMVWCPPGEFWMGSLEDEDGRGENEARRWVKLMRGFWPGRTECRQGLWESVIDSDVGGLKRTDADEECFGEVTATGLDVAMYFTSWDDAQEW